MPVMTESPLAEINALLPDDAIAEIIELVAIGALDGSERITICGITADVDPSGFDGYVPDPMWDRGNDAIYKKMEPQDVEWTVKRWRRMARTIERVFITGV